MTAPRQRFQFTPFTMTWAEVAEAAFRKGENWLREHIGKNALRDFPRADPQLDLFSRKEVEQWIDRRFGIAPSSVIDFENLALEAGRGGIRARRSASRL